ncbi:MAG: hypothetical protein ACE5J4_01665 [Candidatus Aenigmatarchaeota archaeon]
MRDDPLPDSAVRAYGIASIFCLNEVACLDQDNEIKKDVYTYTLEESEISIDGDFFNVVVNTNSKGESFGTVITTDEARYDGFEVLNHLEKTLRDLQGILKKYGIIS